MERYTVEWFDLYMDELLDKMGSDYFPLPIKFNRFITYVEDFVRENAVYDEVKQEVSDDIKTLRVAKKVAATGPDHMNCLLVPEPIDYNRLITIYPLYDGLKKCRRVNIDHAGNELSNSSNPFNNPTEMYPEVRRLSGIFQIDMGGDVDFDKYDKALITYIKKPTFPNITSLEDRIVDLPDLSIEKIVHKTADSFLYRIGDNTAERNYQFTQSIGRKNK